MMTIDESINRLCEIVDQMSDGYILNLANGGTGDLDYELDILKDYQSSKWISVEERLPKCGERVLITDGAAVFEAYLSISHKWVRSGLLWQENVTHWMPLPEPPKEELCATNA